MSKSLATPLKLDRTDVFLYLALTLVAAFVALFLLMSLNSRCQPATATTGKTCELVLPWGQLAIAAGAVEIIGVAAVAWRRRSWAFLGLQKVAWRPAAKYVGLGVLLIIALNLLTIALAQFIPFFAKSQFDLPPHLDQQTIIGFALLAAGIAPIGEELFFRGILFRSIWQRWGMVSGAITSSAIFAALHGISGATAAIFILGLYLCFMYRRLGSIVPGMALHFLNNTAAVIMISLGVR